MMLRRFVPFAVTAGCASLLVAACTAWSPERIGAPGAMPSPAGAGSLAPRLALDATGAVLLTWFEPAGEGAHALRFARHADDAWSPPVTIEKSDSFFVNWADFPALVALESGDLVVSYPWRSGDDPYAYDVLLRRSSDGGATWGAPIRPHTDGTATEHGFVTLLPAGDEVRAMWLDGRNFAGAAGGGHDGHGDGPGPEMTLRTARVARDGSLHGEEMIDTRACDCCQTAGVVTPSGGPVVAWRDRSAGEVRDIRVARRADGAWRPGALHEDGWEIAGCPVNGPAMSADGDRVAIAWYTGAHDTALVRAAFSADGGQTFDAPVTLDGPAPLGRTGVALLRDGTAVVSWIEAVGDSAEVRLQRIGPAGKRADPIVLTPISPRRASGVPQLVRSGGRLICAWTEPGEGVRLAAVPVGSR